MLLYLVESGTASTEYLALYFVLVDTQAENPDSHKYVVAKGRRMIFALSDKTLNCLLADTKILIVTS
jgi:hypothetical protein